MDKETRDQLMKNHEWDLKMEEYELKQRRVEIGSMMEAKYEYEVIWLIPGAIINEVEVNALGTMGYRLVHTVPLLERHYNADNHGVELISGGTSLIFERRKS